MENDRCSKQKEMLNRQDFKYRKQLHNKVLKFKHQLKYDKMKNEWNMEESLFDKFEEKMSNHHRTISRNEEMIKKMKQKETIYMEKLKETVQRRQNMNSSFS